MKINISDYHEMLEYFVKQRHEGDEFVAFLEGAVALSKYDLPTFSNQYEAQEFCYENSTDVDRYDFLSLRSTYRTMADALNDNTLLIEKDSVVDIGRMISIHYERLEKELLNNNQNSKIMKQENFNYLKDQVKYTGFGDGLENDLKQKLETGDDKFKLKHHTQYDNNKLTTILNFSRAKQGDMYFFNSYTVSLKKENTDQTMDQTFYINKGKNITLKEAYNLMQGRAVNKTLTNRDGVEYNAWVQLDFKQTNEDGNHKMKYFSENYGYDLEAVLSKHPIKELNNEAHKKDLIDSLKKGNLQSATFINGEESVKQYIEANPQFKTINIYDSTMQRVDNRQAKKEEQTQGESQGQEQSNKKEKQGAADDDEAPDVPKASKKRSKKPAIS